MYVSPIYSSKNMRASPGIEPGPLAPETSILPLNYEASPNICFLLYFLLFYYFSISHIFRKKIQGHNRIRTNDRGNCSPTLYHWAMRPPVYSFYLYFPCLLCDSFTKTDWKKTPPVGLEPTTLRLKAARSTDWARKALASLSFIPSLSLSSLFLYVIYFFYLLFVTSP